MSDKKLLVLTAIQARDAVLHAEAANLAIYEEKAANLFSFKSWNAVRHNPTSNLQRFINRAQTEYKQIIISEIGIIAGSSENDC